MEKSELEPETISVKPKWKKFTHNEKFRGYYGLDRYYYTTGLYDSSRAIQAQMYAIAKSLNDDSLLADVYHAIANMLVHKSDYNFSLRSSRES